MKRKSFKPGVSLTIFFVFFACVFFTLGLWQIDRGQAKTKIISEFEARSKQVGCPYNLYEDGKDTVNNFVSEGYCTSKSKQWDQVSIDGEFDESKQILLDNVIYNGIAGYKVLTPLKIKSSKNFILVDRGWISRDTFKKGLPKIYKEPFYGEASFNGVLEDPELGLVLSDDLVTKEWPKISQSKNLDILSKEYNYSLEPYILVLNEEVPGTNLNSLDFIGIVPTTMMPVKHYGYSMTWFSMFLAICFMYLWIGFKRNEE